MDESEDENDEDENNDQGQSDGNLLGMLGASVDAKAKTKVVTGFDNLVGTSGSSALAERCRKSGHTLSYLLKPSPMKPTGAKAQRKKHQSPVGVDLDLNAPLDTSIFSCWIEEEKGHRQGSRLSIEAVSFTQQKPLLVSKRNDISKDAISSSDAPLPLSSGALGGTFEEGPSASSGLMNSFQASDNGGQNAPSAAVNKPGAANDPFYLNSSPATIDFGDATSANDNLLNNFGNMQIQLGDDDDEEEPAKKKKKKKKKHKGSEPESTNTLGQGFGNIAIYDSDDDDDDDIGLQPARRTGGRMKGSELSGLANVDLSAPLREDEVFLERKHRVVPEREPEEAPTATETSKSKKKKKKSSKKNKKETNQQVSETPSSGFDLLDLYNSTPMQQATPSASSSQPMNTMQTPTSSVNNAFDDLLGLSNSVPQASPAPSQNAGNDIFAMSMQNNNISQSSASKKSGKKAYLRGTIKASSATGSPSVDWSKIELSYRVSRSKSDNTAVSLVVRVQNNMAATLSGLVLELKNYGDFPIGDAAPSSSVESSKIGPFSYASSDSPLELKGKLKTSDSNVTMKMALPISVYNSPADPGLTMDRVASELASSQWASHSTKIAHDSSNAPEKIKQKVCAFLNMVEIEPADPSFGTLAGISSTGVQIRALVKVRADDVKIDIKSGNVALGKVISSELKKLII